MIDTMILEEAIKKAKEELALKLENGTSGTGSALAQLKSSLEEKLSPWTGTRAAKLDRLDAKVSSRADGSYYTPARGSKLDKLDATVSSRADGSVWTPSRASKIDNIDATISSRASQSSLDSLSAYLHSPTPSMALKRVQRGKIPIGSSGWTAIEDGKFSIKTVLLPYAVDTNKSILTVNTIRSNVSDYIGAYGTLASPKNLVIETVGMAYQDNLRNLYEIFWTVEEWY